MAHTTRVISEILIHVHVLARFSSVSAHFGVQKISGYNFKILDITTPGELLAAGGNFLGF